MAFTYAKVLEITTIAATVGVVYSNPASTTTYIRGIILHNGNTTAETVILYNVPDNAGSAGTPGTTNEFYYEIMPAYSTTILEFPTPGIILTATADTIQADTTTASKCTIQILGATE